MSDFSRTHAALFDELERQGIYCVDVGRLTRAVMEAQRVIVGADTGLRVNAKLRHGCQQCE